MNPTIEFDGKAALRAAEVDDERTNRMLPAKLHAVQATPAQLLPEEILGPRLSGA
jgi:hypothetical protein